MEKGAAVTSKRWSGADWDNAGLKDLTESLSGVSVVAVSERKRNLVNAFNKIELISVTTADEYKRSEIMMDGFLQNGLNLNI